MSNSDECSNGPDQGQHQHGRGPSSFAMHDPDLIFGALGLRVGDTFLDLGCGPGEYALHAARIVGASGLVYALDKWNYFIHDVTKYATSQGLGNIKAMAADITDPLPIQDNSVDVSLMATVLHAINLDQHGKTLFSEIHRVLRPRGRAAIINCKKEDQPFGPPIHMRWAPDEVEDAMTPYGFETMTVIDLGYNYMIQFRVKKQNSVVGD